MLKRKALILFTVVAAAIVLIAYTNVAAQDGCIELKGFEICSKDCALTDGDKVVYNYDVTNIYGTREIKFIDIVVPASVVLGDCYVKKGKNYNCANVETWFNDRKVSNITYGPGLGAEEPSRFAAGITDGIVVRALIGKDLSEGQTVVFSVKFKNNSIGCGSTYVQLTSTPSSNYESNKTEGPFIALAKTVTSSSSWKCKNLGNFETPHGIVPVTMRYKKEPDGCKVNKDNIEFYANNPECVAGCNGLDDCYILPQGQGSKAFRNFCMGTGDNCNECMENSSGSPQEYWYWNNGQLRYSCFDLTGPGYACPTCCYTNASCAACN